MMRDLGIYLAIVVTLIIPATTQEHQGDKYGSKDATGVVILTRTLAAAHLTGVSNTSVIEGWGNIQYRWAGKQVNVPVYAKSAADTGLVLKASLANGAWQLAIGSSIATIQDASDVGRTIPTTATAVMKYAIPFVGMSNAISDPTVSIIRPDQFELDGHQFVRVHAQSVARETNESARIVSKLSGVDIFIDPLTWLVIGIQGTTHDQRDIKDQYPDSIYFADYRSVNGSFLPFTISERLAGQLVWTIRFKSVRLTR